MAPRRPDENVSQQIWQNNTTGSPVRKVTYEDKHFTAKSSLRNVQAGERAVRPVLSAVCGRALERQRSRRASCSRDSDSTVATCRGESRGELLWTARRVSFCGARLCETAEQNAFDRERCGKLTSLSRLVLRATAVMFWGL